MLLTDYRLPSCPSITFLGCPKYKNVLKMPASSVLMALKETFRATFGRETAVKDMTWLKRRIAVGLINSFCYNQNSNKEDILTEVDQDMEPDDMESSVNSSDDNSNTGAPNMELGSGPSR
ncbi:Uncharacterized protein Rs2_04044 [Raphanus sativus]|nr:Uncharacterized protein Rs2_04044 [Raphanus sativus]